jgi:hypothetical protein
MVAVQVAVQVKKQKPSKRRHICSYMHLQMLAYNCTSSVMFQRISSVMDCPVRESMALL